MALRGTLTHRKTRRLARALDIPPCFALGLLEALWHVTAEQTPDGAIGRMSDDDIAMEMFYDRDAAALVEALVGAELLDRHATHRLVVHDWHLHSDDATDNKLARARQCYANGEKPRMRKLSKEERARILADFPGFGESVRTEGHNGALPEPEPEPDAKTTTPLPPSRGEGVERGAGQAAPKAEDATKSPAEARARNAVGGGAICRESVAKVLRECNLSDPRLEGVIAKAMALEHSKSDAPPDCNATAERMIASYERYERDAPLMAYRPGARKFFAHGLWRSRDLWPYDARKLAEARTRSGATVGMYSR